MQGYSAEFFVSAGEPLGAYWGNRWATSCAELDPLVQSDCENQFQVNDDGLLVWVGSGYNWNEGITNRLWGTSGYVGIATASVEYDWGMPIRALECQRRGVDGTLINVPAIQCDANGDGDIDAVPEGFTSQTLSDYLRIGDTTPDFAWSLSTNLRYKQFTFYALIDSEIGHDQYFQTGQWAMREGASAFIDQQNKSDATKKPYLYYQYVYNVNAASSFFIMSGSYAKIRELALGYTFNRDRLSSFAGFLGLDGASIRLVGRNLLTITDYPGYDPETSTGTGGSDVIGRTDAYNYPNFRTFTATIDLIF
jgi:hypothetical protein